MRRRGWIGTPASTTPSRLSAPTVIRCLSLACRWAAALALRLAERHGHLVSGLVLVNPVINISDPRMRALPILRLAVPSLAGIVNDIAKPGQDECGYDRLPLPALYSQTFLWADVRRNLDRVDQPLLIYRAIHDHVVDGSSVNLIKAGVTIRGSDLRRVAA